MNELEIIKDSGLHDYELVSLTIDCAKATIVLDAISPLKNHVSHPISIHIHGFISFSVSHREPWGKGKYIYSSNIQAIGANTYRIELQLNSGDLILIDVEDRGTVPLS